MAKAGYRVIGANITTETRLHPNGTGIQDVHVVPYRIESGPAKGVIRSVKVPTEEFNADNVKLAIEDDVNKTHDIASIGQ